MKAFARVRILVMRPTSIFLLALRIILWSGLFVILLTGLAIGVAYGLTWLQESEDFAGTNLSLGIVCGLVAALFMIVFHLRRETMHFPFSEREVFVQRLTHILHDLGYEVIGQSRDQVRFQPAFTAFLLGGTVSVKLEAAISTIVGPRVTLEILRQRLRLQHHLEIVQQSFHENRRRHPENLLKRAQLTVRLPPDRWAEVVERLQTVLSADAEIIGDLHILLQSRDGIPESVIDEEVRNWLHERGIDVEVHKNLVKMPRPSGHDFGLPPVNDKVPL
jgi:hypothetical protein